MTYRAPVKDIRFCLEEIAAIDGLKPTGGFPEFSDDLMGAILEEAAKLSNDVIAPTNWTGDQEGCTLKNGEVTTPSGFKEAYAAYVEGGWQGLAAPTSAGGMGLPRALGAAVMEMLQSANMAFGLGPMLSLGAINALTAHGTPEQQEMYLPKIVSGAWSATMNLTEPQAGSDVGALKTKAEPKGDGSWAISGQKIYITWGEHDCAENIIHLVLARTPDAPAGTKGISLFIVPKFLVNADGSLGERNSLQAIGLEHKLGIHGSPTCTMEFDGATGWLIGPEQGGMRCMFTMMNDARLHVGVQGVGIAERAYQRALAYAKDRRQGQALSGEGEAPHAIIDHPDVRRSLSLMKAKIEAARAICFHCAVEADFAEHHDDKEEAAWSHRREALMTPLAKAWGTDIGVEVCSEALQIHGGMGFIEETGAAQHYRDARIAPIYEGTNAIQAIDLVGRKLAMDGGKGMQELIEDIQQTVEDCATSSNEDLNHLATRLGPAGEALASAAQWLKEADEEDRLTGATPFLRLTAEIAGGWLLCVGAVAAQRQLKEGEAEGVEDYAQSRIDLAYIYAEAVLAAAPCVLNEIRLGADAIFAPGRFMLESQ